MKPAPRRQPKNDAPEPAEGCFVNASREWEPIAPPALVIKDITTELRALKAGRG